MSIGERLKIEREKRGWTQIQAAKKTGLSSQVISNYERGYRNPDPDALATLADVYNVNVDFLLGRTDDPLPSLAKQMLRAAEQRLQEKDMNGKVRNKGFLSDDMVIKAAEIFSRIPKEDQENLLKFMEGMVKKKE